MDEIFELAMQLSCNPRRGEMLSKYTTFKVGGPAELFVEPVSEESLSQILRLCKQKEIRVIILGNGSNMLFNDTFIHGVVLHIGGAFDWIHLNDDGVTITCGAGVRLRKLSNFAAEHSLSGLEFAHGIPGTVGGAVYMNAGAYGGEIKDVIVSAYYVSQCGECGEFGRNELDMSYRHSIFCENNDVVTKISLTLNYGKKDEIAALMDDLAMRRKMKQPIEYPSAGSTFKRPAGYYAAALIEECGLKGREIGGAAVSEKHAGFIINKGGATYDDIIRLIDHVKSVVYEKKGVMLEPEVRIIAD